MRASSALLEAQLEPHVEGGFLGQGRVGLEDGLLEAGQVGQRGGADEAGGERGPVGQIAGDLGRVEQFAGAGKAAGEKDLQVAAGEPDLEAELGGAGQPRLAAHRVVEQPGMAGTVVVTWEDVAPYLRNAPKPVDGEVYVLKTLTQSPEAVLTRKLGERPKGTILRLGTNGNLQVVLPKR